jgi:hypothetical protein
MTTTSGCRHQQQCRIAQSHPWTVCTLPDAAASESTLRHGCDFLVSSTRCVSSENNRAVWAILFATCISTNATLLDRSANMLAKRCIATTGLSSALRCRYLPLSESAFSSPASPDLGNFALCTLACRSAGSLLRTWQSQSCASRKALSGATIRRLAACSATNDPQPPINAPAWTDGESQSLCDPPTTLCGCGPAYP